MQTVEHVKAIPEALGIKLSKEDIHAIQDATPFNPLFPMNFLFNFKGDQRYNLDLTAADNQQYQMTSWINAPPKPSVSELSSMLLPTSSLADPREALRTTRGESAGVEVKFCSEAENDHVLFPALPIPDSTPRSVQSR